MAVASEWIHLKKDFSKKVILNGNEGKRPRFWSEVDGKICKTIVDSTTLCSENWEEFSKLRIGMASDEWSRLIETCLQLMNEGEVSEFRARTLEGKSIEFQINLINIVSQPALLPYWEVSEVIQVSKQMKDLAVLLHKEKKTIDSYYLFSRALKTLLPVEIKLTKQLANDAEKKDETKELLKENVTTTVASLYNNLAACQLLEANFGYALQLCDQALERTPSDLKAIYRKASALIGKEWELYR